jgi:post-segregation antitoxin (ccd killing protein)
MPATVAADLFARARDAHQPVSRTASDLLAKALDDACGDAMV